MAESLSVYEHPSWPKYIYTNQYRSYILNVSPENNWAIA